MEGKLKRTKDRPYLPYVLVFRELTDNILPLRQNDKFGQRNRCFMRKNKKRRNRRFASIFTSLSFHPFCRVQQEIPAPRELKGPRDLRSVSVSYFIYFAACFFCRLILDVLEEMVTLLSLSVFKNFGCILFRGAVVFLDR